MRDNRNSCILRTLVAIIGGTMGHRSEFRKPLTTKKKKMDGYNELYQLHHKNKHDIPETRNAREQVSRKSQHVHFSCRVIPRFSSQTLKKCIINLHNQRQQVRQAIDVQVPPPTVDLAYAMLFLLGLPLHYKISLAYCIFLTVHPYPPKKGKKS